MCMYARFFPSYFSCPFCRFSIFVFFPFSIIFFTLSRKWRPTLFALKLRRLFFWFSGHSVKEIFKLLNKVWMIKVNKLSKAKTLEDKTRSVWPSFSQCVRNVIEKAVSICVLNLHNTKVKKTSNSQYQSFEHNGMKIYDQQRLESLEEKKAAHADMVSEGFGNFIAKGDRLANSRDVNPLETIWIIVDELTYKEPSPK